MQIDLDKIKKLPPDVKKDFMKMYLKLDEKKKILKVKDDFLSFAKHMWPEFIEGRHHKICLLYTSPSPRDGLLSRMPSSA